MYAPHTGPFIVYYVRSSTTLYVEQYCTFISFDFGFDFDFHRRIRYRVMCLTIGVILLTVLQTCKISFCSYHRHLHLILRSTPNFSKAGCHALTPANTWYTRCACSAWHIEHFSFQRCASPLSEIDFSRLSSTKAPSHSWISWHLLSTYTVGGFGGAVQYLPQTFKLIYFMHFLIVRRCYW